MSEWAVLGEHTLVVTWSTREGMQAEEVVADPRADYEQLRSAAQVLTYIAAALWDIHALPSAVEPGELPRGRLVEQAASVLDVVVDSGVSLPRQPSPLLDVIADLAVELFDVVRLLPISAVTAVSRELEHEVAAVRDAVADRFTGRALQALCASRPWASPTQVRAARAALAVDPYSMRELMMTAIEPAAAATAACEWFTAALWAVQRQCDYSSLVEIVCAADGMAELPMAVLSSVADQVEAGVEPAVIVERMLQDAVLAREGWALPRVPVAAGRPARQRCWPSLAAVALDRPDRISTLSPATAGPELLVALMRGIAGCRDLYVVEGTPGTAGELDALEVEFAALMRDELDEQ